MQELVRFLERAHSRMGSLAAHLAGDATATQNGTDLPPSATAASNNGATLPDRRNSDAFPRRTSESDSNASPPSNRDFTW